MDRSLTLNETDLILGSSLEKVVPNINASKWNDESFVNLNYSKMEGADYSIDKGVSILTKGSEQFKWWQLNDEVLEAAVVFASKPVSNEIRLKLLKSDNLSFNYQGILTEEEIAEGHGRDAKTSGSYAVYIDKAYNEYRAGKFAHLYRWEVIDAKGQKAWCKPLAIDGDDLVITMPGRFLETAVYPVIAMGADDTFGYTSVGASSLSVSTSLKSRCGLPGRYTAAAGKEITGYSFYGKYNASSQTIEMAAYSDVSSTSADTASRLAAAQTVTIDVSSPDWRSVSGLSQALTENNVYGVAFGNISGAMTCYYDNESNGHSAEDNAGALPATWSELTAVDLRFSMYSTFDSSAAGNPWYYYNQMNMAAQ